MNCDYCYQKSKECGLCLELDECRANGNDKDLFKEMAAPATIINVEFPKKTKKAKKQRVVVESGSSFTPATVTTEETTSGGGISINSSHQSPNNDSPESLSGRMNLGYAIRKDEPSGLLSNVEVCSLPPQPPVINNEFIKVAKTTDEGEDASVSHPPIIKNRETSPPEGEEASLSGGAPSPLSSGIYPYFCHIIITFITIK